MPAILYGAPGLPEFETEKVLDQIEEWLADMIKEDLLTIQRTPHRLAVTSPTLATVTIERVDDTRLDMSRVLLGKRFSLRIVKASRCGGKQWELLDKHGMRQPLLPETFYGELKELIGPPGPSWIVDR